MSSLLEQAKKIGNRKTRELTEEGKELIMAYLKGEINSSQARIVLGKDGVQFYSYALIVVRELIAEGKIILT